LYDAGDEHDYDYDDGAVVAAVGDGDNRENDCDYYCRRVDSDGGEQRGLDLNDSIVEADKLRLADVNYNGCCCDSGY
jgi:hypothetical protein